MFHKDEELVRKPAAEGLYHVAVPFFNIQVILVAFVLNKSDQVRSGSLNESRDVDK